MSDGTEDNTAANPDVEANAAAAAAEAAGNQSGDPKDTPSDTSGQQAGSDLFADLDGDTREWLTKREIKDAKAAAKLAYEQSKLLGNAIRVPGKDAPAEEREAFLNKLGRPEKEDGYDFTPPKDLPEALPYDGERATAFKGLAHKIGLTKEQAAAVHDWAVNNAVEDFKSIGQQTAERNAGIAKAETEKLEKLWGPLNGDQMKANLTYADKVLREVGGADTLAEFQRVGLIGKEGNVILSAPIAVMLSKLGAAVFKEDDVLRGNPSRLNNPFEEGQHFNVTAQMALYKQDKEQALAMIAAAGKKPEDFGIKG